MKVREPAFEEWEYDYQDAVNEINRLDTLMETGVINANNLASTEWPRVFEYFMSGQPVYKRVSVWEFGEARAKENAYWDHNPRPIWFIEGPDINQVYLGELYEGTDWGWATLPNGQLVVADFMLFADDSKHNPEFNGATCHVWDAGGYRHDYPLDDIVAGVRERVLEEAWKEQAERLAKARQDEARRFLELTSKDGALLAKYGLQLSDSPDDQIQGVTRYLEDESRTHRMQQLKNRAEAVLKETEELAAKADQYLEFAEFYNAARPDEGQQVELVPGPRIRRR